LNHERGFNFENTVVLTDALESVRWRVCCLFLDAMKNLRLLCCGAILSAAFVGGIVPDAMAAVFCVGPSATGDGSGKDWNNQTAWSSITPSRGNTYYLADGTYGGKTLNAAPSGSAYITIKKATVGDSAVEGITGWSSTFGDGQASFSGTIVFNQSYYIFDGVKGSMTRVMTDYGFTFPNTVRYPVRTFNLSTAISDISISHISWTAPSSDVEKFFHSTDNSTKSVHRLTISHCLSDGHSNFQWGTSAALAMDDWVTEYNIMRRCYSSAAVHGEDLNNNYGNIRNWHIRYNLFEEQGSGGAPTGVIVVLNGAAGPYYVYGNVFQNMRWAEVGIGGIHHNMSGAVYNNTFINCQSVYNYSQWIGGGRGNTLTAQNNLLVNMRADRNGSGTISHNTYANCTSVPSGELNSQILSSSGLINTTTFQLVQPTAAGATLSSPYSTDPSGKARGTDGTWDRGAYELGGVVATPTISVSPNALNFGPVETNSIRDLNFTVQNNGGGTLTGNVTDATPFAVVAGGAYSLGAGQSQTVTIRYSPAVLGSHSQNVTFSGGGGIIANVSGIAVMVDNAAPIVALSSPAHGLTVSNTVGVTATASDNVGVVGVKFFINGNELFDDTSSPYSYSWDTLWVSNGSHQVYAQARDAVGNIGWSATNTITVANPLAALPEPIAYWNFNEGSGATATDSNANNVLTLRNGATMSAVGKFGSGLLLDGVNDRADAPNSASLNITGSAISVAAWVKIESQATWQQFVVKVKETGAFTPPYFAWHLFGSHASTTQWTPRFQLANTEGISVDVGSSLNVNYDEWVHLVGIYDGAMVRIYVNGVDQGSAPQGGNILGYNQPLYIGAHGLPGEFAKGIIDEVRIYSSALSAMQVQALYVVGGTGAAPAPPVGLRVVGL
jgi:hypothetical protein